MRGLFIGRFQPFHLGHLSVVDRMARECDTVIIGVGSPEIAREEKNPFSGGERIEMIKKVLDGRGYEHYEIYPVPDINCYPKWPHYVMKILPRFDVVYGDTGIVTELFRGIGVKVVYVETTHRHNWKGCEVRRRMKEGDRWDDLVPPEVFQYIAELDVGEVMGPRIEVKIDTGRELAHLLTKNGMTISTAESCTGGLIATRLTDIPGSSVYFERGVVSYSNDSKIELLGVEKGLLEEFGAVSPEVAMAMATGIREMTRTDIGLSVTGIAGPGGGSEMKPVGTVFIGLSTKYDTLFRKHGLSGNRLEIRSQASEEAMNWVISILRDQCTHH